MAVPNETILKKMMDELKQAQQNHENYQQMVKHIEHVRLLSDLIVEGKQDYPKKDSTKIEDISDDEMKAMLGNTKTTDNHHRRDESSIDHDDANGKSIFDF